MLRNAISTNLEAGTSFIETLWFSYASRIIDKAIQLYNLNEEQAKNLSEKFLKRGDFILILERYDI
jgi:hypothetical protein